MVNWTPEKHQIILKGIFQFCEIKMSKELTQYLANEIGEGCTPKAVHNILCNLKNHGKASGPGRNAASSKAGAATSTPSKSTPRSTPGKTPASAGGRTRTKKTMDDDDAGPTNELGAAASPSAGRKRSRTEDASESVSKKIKTERIDDDIFQHEDFFPTVEEHDAVQEEI